MTYQGGCQCGAVAFEADGEIESLMECNCSICKPKGYLLWFVPNDQFRLKTEGGAMGEYRFNQKHLAHRFCLTCGVSPFVEGPGMVAVNARVLKDFDPKDTPITAFDGAAR